MQAVYQFMLDTGLTLHQARIVSLLVVDDLTQKQVAAIYDMPQPRIAEVVRRARRRCPRIASMLRRRGRPKSKYISADQ